jgi:GTPase SAR1 family protein
MNANDRTNRPADSPRIVVVGPCASGKSTLVGSLRADGIDARVSGQEHSAIRDLWRKLKPDLLVFLDVDLGTIRQRRSPHWPEALYRLQYTRLHGARETADLVIDTSVTSAEEARELVLELVEDTTSRPREPS